MRPFIARSALGLGLTLALVGCTDPYSPGQRAVGGGLLGAGAGAAIGGLAGGGRGAATGALIGGGLGAVGGAVTTPNRPPPSGYDQSAPGYAPSYPPQPSYGY
jgi:predicted lipid-binding transport protein (Tim44 family)